MRSCFIYSVEDNCKIDFAKILKAIAFLQSCTTTVLYSFDCFLVKLLVVGFVTEFQLFSVDFLDLNSNLDYFKNSRIMMTIGNFEDLNKDHFIMIAGLDSLL